MAAAGTCWCCLLRQERHGLRLPQLANTYIQPVAFTDDVTDLQVPPLLDKEEVRERLKRLAGGPTQPLTVHLRQEIDRYVTVCLHASIQFAPGRLDELEAVPAWLEWTIALPGGFMVKVTSTVLMDNHLCLSWIYCPTG